MKFALDLTEAQLERIEEHLDIRAAIIAGHADHVTFPDQIFGMVLGAARSAGYQKPKRRIKA